VLDPGAGSGMLSAAIVDRLRRERPGVPIHLVAVENDRALLPALHETLGDLESLAGVTTELVSADFLAWGLLTGERFDLAIQNPPYAKLRTGSDAQDLLRGHGVIVPNVYAAFLTLGLRLLVDGGQQVAITPRSWMNGAYYATFRRELVRTAGIDAIHTFESRSTVFGDAGVLQESIVVSVTRGRFPGQVAVHRSHDHLGESTSRTVAVSHIVTPDFIHVPATEQDAQAVAWMTMHAAHTLADLGLTVSTGRVVDFRSRAMLHQDRVAGAVPMVTASHLRDGVTRHPAGTRKPEWFRAVEEDDAKLLVDGGAYVLVKRFSAKEERRRVVAAVWRSTEKVAFDNKLNYIHLAGAGFDAQIARGLAVFLNSTRLDAYFRVFSGHTQVNATDLRQMRFPSTDQLRALADTDVGDQRRIDSAVDAALVTSALAVVA
jgi:adenine-specific DNA-methyltransferase